MHKFPLTLGLLPLQAQVKCSQCILDIFRQYTLGYTDDTLAYGTLVHWSPSVYTGMPCYVPWVPSVVHWHTLSCTLGPQCSTVAYTVMCHGSLVQYTGIHCHVPWALVQYDLLVYLQCILQLHCDHFVNPACRQGHGAFVHIINDCPLNILDQK